MDRQIRRCQKFHRLFQKSMNHVLSCLQNNEQNEQSMMNSQSSFSFSQSSKQSMNVKSQSQSKKNILSSSFENNENNNGSMRKIRKIISNSFDCRQENDPINKSLQISMNQEESESIVNSSIISMQSTGKKNSLSMNHNSGPKNQKYSFLEKSERMDSNEYQNKSQEQSSSVIEQSAIGLEKEGGNFSPMNEVNQSISIGQLPDNSNLSLIQVQNICQISEERLKSHGPKLILNQNIRESIDQPQSQSYQNGHNLSREISNCYIEKFKKLNNVVRNHTQIEKHENFNDQKDESYSKILNESLLQELNANLSLQKLRVSIQQLQKQKYPQISQSTMEKQQINQPNSIPTNPEAIDSNQQNKNSNQSFDMNDQSLIGQLSSSSRVNNSNPSQLQKINAFFNPLGISSSRIEALSKSIRVDTSEIKNSSHLDPCIHQPTHTQEDLKSYRQLQQLYQPLFPDMPYSQLRSENHTEYSREQLDQINKIFNKLNRYQLKSVFLIKLKQKKHSSVQKNISQSNVQNVSIDLQLNVNGEDSKGFTQNKSLEQKFGKLSSIRRGKRSNNPSKSKDSHIQKLSQYLRQLVNHKGKEKLFKQIIMNTVSSGFQFKTISQYYRVVKLQDFVHGFLVQDFIANNQLELYKKVIANVIDQQKPQENQMNHIDFEYFLRLNLDMYGNQKKKRQSYFTKILKCEWNEVSVMYFIVGKFTDNNWKQLVKCHKFKNLKILLFKSDKELNIEYQQFQELISSTQLKYLKFHKYPLEVRRECHFQYHMFSSSSMLSILQYCNYNQEIVINFTENIEIVFSYQGKQQQGMTLYLSKLNSIDLNLIFKPLNNSIKSQLKLVQKLFLKNNSIDNDGFQFIVQNIAIFQNLSYIDLQGNNITQIRRKDLIKLYFYKSMALKKLKQNNLIKSKQQIKKLYDENKNQIAGQARHRTQLRINIKYNKLNKQSYLLIHKYTLSCLNPVIRFLIDFQEQFSQHSAYQYQQCSQPQLQQQRCQNLLLYPPNIMDIIGWLEFFYQNSHQQYQQFDQQAIQEQINDQDKQLLNVNKIPEMINYTAQLYKQTFKLNQTNKNIKQHQIASQNLVKRLKQKAAEICSNLKFRPTVLEQLKKVQDLCISKIKQWFDTQNNQSINDLSSEKMRMLPQ